MFFIRKEGIKGINILGLWIFLQFLLGNFAYVDNNCKAVPLSDLEVEFVFPLLDDNLSDCRSVVINSHNVILDFIYLLPFCIEILLVLSLSIIYFP